MHPIRVLESFGPPRPTTNPYIVQLAAQLEREPECELVFFSFVRAIVGRYDVFHVHWPEVVFSGHSRIKTLGREGLTALILARVQISRKALVRTRHNIELPAGLSRRQLFLIAWFERLTTMSIHLNAVTSTVSGEPSAIIPHGDYREWFASLPKQDAVVGRIAYFGLIRRYKGVEGLVAAFRQTNTPGLSLSVSGNPSTVAMQEQLLQSAGGDPRVEFAFRFLPDAELVLAVTSAELVALPYRFMHNSGATLTALSLDRPVLVPDTEVNRLLAAEVGQGWVHRYSGELTADAVDSAIASLRANPPVGKPDLTARSWEKAGERHMRVFDEAVAFKRRRRVTRFAVREPSEVSLDGIPRS